MPLRKSGTRAIPLDHFRFCGVMVQRRQEGVVVMTQQNLLRLRG